MKTSDEVIAERNTTHGDFGDNAKCSQWLKNAIKSEAATCKTNLTAVQLEALDMICLKLSRIVTGQPNVADHWLDIEGYARLARKEIEEDG